MARSPSPYPPGGAGEESGLILFVDAHVHFWNLGRLRYPWLTPPFDDTGPNGSVERIARTYLPADYRRDAARWNLVGAVHVDAGAHPADALAETEWLEEMASADGLPSGIVAFAALHEPEVDTLLAAHAANPRVRGIRHIVNWHPDPHRTYTPRDLIGDEAWQRGYALLARHGLSFDLQCYPGQMPALARFLAGHPETRVIVDHAGMPVPGDRDGMAEWRAGMAALAALAHVHVKLSGFGFAHRPWSTEAIAPLLCETIALFGTRRCLFASDFPTDALFAPFDAHMEAYHSLTDDLAEDERRDLWGRNANRFYRLGLAL